MYICIPSHIPPLLPPPPPFLQKANEQAESRKRKAEQAAAKAASSSGVPSSTSSSASAAGGPDVEEIRVDDLMRGSKAVPVVNSSAVVDDGRPINPSAAYTLLE